MKKVVPPQIPSGFRDIPPALSQAREHIFQAMRTTFSRYGFVPLETPAMENLATLTGKYGDEGDKLLFKVLNSGEFLATVTTDDLQQPANRTLHKVSKKGLRYDLTVPLARYVAQRRHEINLPFQRYQMQRVWRAERPQKGRYREFYQCDVDVVGAFSSLYEASLLTMAYEVLATLGITDAVVHLNDRRVIQALAVYTGMGEQTHYFYQTLDKLQKIGVEEVIERLIKVGMNATGTTRLERILALEGTTEDRITQMKGFFADIPTGLTALNTLQTIVQQVAAFDKETYRVLSFTPTLARGMDYYTGAIFEVQLPEKGVGSVVGGGRYDNLTHYFGLEENLPCVGLSFGFERICDVMQARHLFPETKNTQVLLAPMDHDAEIEAIRYTVALRKRGISTMLYPSGRKLKKILTYANHMKVGWVGIIGSEEMASKCLMLKDMNSGIQKKCTFGEMLIKLNDVSEAIDESHRTMAKDK